MNKKMLIQAPCVKAEETMKKCRQTPLFKVIVFIATYVKKTLTDKSIRINADF